MITPKGRFSFVFVFEKNPHITPSKYSVVYLIPKTNAAGIQRIKDEINKAAEKGIANGRHTKEDTMKANFGQPLHDGDKAEGKGPEYKGHMYMNCKTDSMPDVVGPDAMPLMSQKDIYSGCFGRLDVNFSAYPTKSPNRGVGVYLNNVMKLEDGPRLDGKQSGEDAFAKYAEDANNTQGELE